MRVKLAVVRFRVHYYCENENSRATTVHLEAAWSQKSEKSLKYEGTSSVFVLVVVVEDLSEPVN